MSVAAHMKIRLDEYDARIPTFIPGYHQMLDRAALCLRALPAPPRTIVDLGTGTGALAARCLQQAPGAALVGIDEGRGRGHARLARQRLGAAGGIASLVTGSFLDVQVPACDAVVASLALHHVRTRERKQVLFEDIRRALRPGGLLVNADCCPSSDPALARVEREAWHAHLRAANSEEETQANFDAWAAEDVYVPLEEELAMLRQAGFTPEVVWRLAPMAVIASRSG
jgi:tRNA (cmo5U34)-methyltransferase